MFPGAILSWLCFCNGKDEQKSDGIDKMRCDLNSKKQAICHCQEKKMGTPSLCCCCWGAPTHKPTPRSLALGLKPGSTGKELRGEKQRTLWFESFLQASTSSSLESNALGVVPSYLVGLGPPYHIRGCHNGPSVMTVREPEGLQTPIKAVPGKPGPAWSPWEPGKSVLPPPPPWGISVLIVSQLQNSLTHAILGF